MRSKSRLIAVAASVLACAAMVGTGFASWVILDAQSKDVSGNVTAEAVAEQKITLEVSTSSNINYGSPETMGNASAWLVESEDKGQGQFVADITVTVQGNIKSLTIEYSHTGEGLATAITNNLVAEYPTYTIGDEELAPTGSITDANNITVDTSAGNGKATLKFGSGEEKTETFNFAEKTTFHVLATFGWGSAFNSQNPYDFFNAKTKTATATEWGIAGGTVDTPTEGSGTGEAGAVTWGDVAKGVLGWMNTNFAGANYKFTFNATQAAAKAGA